MSSVILDSLIVPEIKNQQNQQIQQAEQTEQAQQNETPWVRGVTQGAIYTITKAELNQAKKKIQKETYATKNKTRAWVQEAIKTQTNIDAMVKDLNWTLLDCHEVAEQQSQLNIINMQRENTILHFHCTQIIRKVTKSIIRLAAKQQMNTFAIEDHYRRNQLEKMEVFFAKMCSKRSWHIQGNISEAEAESRRIRQSFYNQLCLLKRDQDRYLTISIKEMTRININHSCSIVKQLAHPYPSLTTIIENIHRKALESLNPLPIIDSEQMYQECQKIVGEANKTLMPILITLNANWSSGNCSKEVA